MKAIVIEQPWASLACCGVCGDAKVPQGTFTSEVLVYASAPTLPVSITDLPMRVAMQAANLENTGYLKCIDHLPYNALVGKARIRTLLPLESMSQADLAVCRMEILSASLFAHPVFDVEHSGYIFDVDDTAALPPVVPIEMFDRDGSTLRVRVSDRLLSSVERGSGKGVRLVFNLDRSNFHYFCSREMETKPTTRVVLWNGERRSLAAVSEFECYEVVSDDETPRLGKASSFRWVQAMLTLA